MPVLAPSPAPRPSSPCNGPALRVAEVDFHYGSVKALSDISLDIPAHEVTAFIGPSGCGKTTLLRCFNRMNDLIEGARVTRGRVEVHGADILAPSVDPVRLRRDVGMVFQKSNPFPLTIRENITYGLRLGGLTDRQRLEEAVERSLQSAALWDEVKDRLDDGALGLSGGQQQRLCIARALAVEPRILLMDEPCSALDPIATGRVEDLIHELRRLVTVVIVTHNMQQATRVSRHTAFFYMGRLVEFAETTQLFSNPREAETEAYVSGKFS